MSSSPQDQNQESNPEPSRELKEEEEQKDGMKEEVKAEEKQDVTEKKEERKEVKESWTDLIYNRRTREFLGRTASSWGKTGSLTPSVWLMGRVHRPGLSRSGGPLSLASGEPSRT